MATTIKICPIATPNRSIGFSPFEVVYGRNLRSPLDLIMSEFNQQDTRNVKALDWVLDLQKRVESVRVAVKENAEKSQCERKIQADKLAVTRKYEVGEMVLTRIPGMINKLEHAWDGPFEILEVPNDVHLVLSACGKGRKKGRRVHANHILSVLQMCTGWWCLRKMIQSWRLPRHPYWGRDQLDCSRNNWMICWDNLVMF